MFLLMQGSVGAFFRSTNGTQMSIRLCPKKKERKKVSYAPPKGAVTVK